MEKNVLNILHDWGESGKWYKCIKFSSITAEGKRQCLK